MVGYVDDGAYSYACKQAQVLSTVLTQKYDKLANWMNSNMLVINPEKTLLMVMGSRKFNCQRSQVSIKAGDYDIKPSEAEKLLGGWLHHSLSWNLHIRGHSGSLLNQLIKRINGLKKISVNSCFKTKLMVANGLVMSKLTYLITLWGGAPDYLLNGLQVQQLSAARVVCGFVSWRWSRRQLLAKVGWLSVKQLIFYQDVLQIHKTLSSGVPKCLYNELTAPFPRETRSASSGDIRLNNRCANRATFKYRAIQSYNSVPVELRTGTVAAVKTRLKKWIKTNIAID